MPGSRAASRLWPRPAAGHAPVVAYRDPVQQPPVMGEEPGAGRVVAYGRFGQMGSQQLEEEEVRGTRISTWHPASSGLPLQGDGAAQVDVSDL